MAKKAELLSLFVTIFSLTACNFEIPGISKTSTNTSENTLSNDSSSIDVTSSENTTTSSSGSTSEGGGGSVNLSEPLKEYPVGDVSSKEFDEFCNVLKTGDSAKEIFREIFNASCLTVTDFKYLFNTVNSFLKISEIKDADSIEGSLKGALVSLQTFLVNVDGDKIGLLLENLFLSSFLNFISPERQLDFEKGYLGLNQESYSDLKKYCIDNKLDDGYLSYLNSLAPFLDSSYSFDLEDPNLLLLNSYRDVIDTPFRYLGRFVKALLLSSIKTLSTLEFAALLSMIPLGDPQSGMNALKIFVNEAIYESFVTKFSTIDLSLAHLLNQLGKILEDSEPNLASQQILLEQIFSIVIKMQDFQFLTKNWIPLDILELSTKKLEELQRKITPERGAALYHLITTLAKEITDKEIEAIMDAASKQTNPIDILYSFLDAEFKKMSSNDLVAINLLFTDLGVDFNDFLLSLSKMGTLDLASEAGLYQVMTLFQETLDKLSANVMYDLPFSELRNFPLRKDVMKLGHKVRLEDFVGEIGVFVGQNHTDSVMKKFDFDQFKTDKLGKTTVDVKVILMDESELTFRYTYYVIPAIDYLLDFEFNNEPNFFNGVIIKNDVAAYSNVVCAQHYSLKSLLIPNDFNGDLKSTIVNVKDSLFDDAARTMTVTEVHLPSMTETGLPLGKQFALAKFEDAGQPGGYALIPLEVYDKTNLKFSALSNVPEEELSLVNYGAKEFTFRVTLETDINNFILKVSYPIKYDVSSKDIVGEFDTNTPGVKGGTIRLPNGVEVESNSLYYVLAPEAY